MLVSTLCCQMWLVSLPMDCWYCQTCVSGVDCITLVANEDKICIDFERSFVYMILNGFVWWGIIHIVRTQNTYWYFQSPRCTHRTYAKPPQSNPLSAYILYGWTWMFTETNSLSTLLHVADAVSFFLFDIREHCFHFSYALQPFACLLFAVICLFLIWFDLALCHCLCDCGATEVFWFWLMIVQLQFFCLECNWLLGLFGSFRFCILCVWECGWKSLWLCHQLCCRNQTGTKWRSNDDSC